MHNPVWFTSIFGFRPKKVADFAQLFKHVSIWQRKTYTLHAVSVLEGEDDLPLSEAEEEFVRRAIPAKELEEIIFYRSCIVHRAFIYSVNRSHEWRPNDERGWCASFSEESKNEVATIALPYMEQGCALDDLRDHTELLLKVHHLLWAYASRDVTATYAIPKKHLYLALGWELNKGGARREHARSLDLALSLLSQMQVRVESGNGNRIGRLWYVVVDKESSKQWGKHRVCFRPGAWLTESAITTFTSMGRLSRSYLTLQAKTHKWPLLLGSYFSLHERIARKNKVPLRRLTSSTLAHLGLNQTDEAQPRLGKRLMDALLALRDVGLIKSVNIGGHSLDAPEEEEGRDAPDSLHRGAQEAQAYEMPEEWQDKVLEVQTCYFEPPESPKKNPQRRSENPSAKTKKPSP